MILVICVSKWTNGSEKTHHYCENIRQNTEKAIIQIGRRGKELDREKTRIYGPDLGTI